MTDQKRYHYVRRLSDGLILDVPHETLEQTLKDKDSQGRPLFEYVSEVVLNPMEIGNVPVIEETPGAPRIDNPGIPQGPINQNKCILCGFEGKSPKSLQMHGMRKHR